MGLHWLYDLPASLRAELSFWGGQVAGEMAMRQEAESKVLSAKKALLVQTSLAVCTPCDPPSAQTALVISLAQFFTR